MKTKEFIKIMEQGFEAAYEGEETELRCFKCGEKAKLTKIKKGWHRSTKIIECTNKHHYELIDFVTKHINMRDGVAKAFMNNSCSFQKL